MHILLAYKWYPIHVCKNIYHNILYLDHPNNLFDIDYIEFHQNLVYIYIDRQTKI